MGSREEIVVAAMVGVGVGLSSFEWHKRCPLYYTMPISGKLMAKIHFVKLKLWQCIV